MSAVDAVGAAAEHNDDARTALLRQSHDIVYLPLGAAAYGGAERSIIKLAKAQQRADVMSSSDA